MIGVGNPEHRLLELMSMIVGSQKRASALREAWPAQ
jgi:hypothetical protein